MARNGTAKRAASTSVQTHADDDVRAAQIAAAFSSVHSGSSTALEEQARIASVETGGVGRTRHRQERAADAVPIR